MKHEAVVQLRYSMQMYGIYILGMNAVFAFSPHFDLWKSNSQGHSRWRAILFGLCKLILPNLFSNILTILSILVLSVFFRFPVLSVQIKKTINTCQPNFFRNIKIKETFPTIWTISNNFFSNFDQALPGFGLFFLD